MIGVLRFKSKNARIIYESLKPDLEISMRRGEILFKIEREDISSFRACINSYLRLLSCLERIL